jgi:hypothetical protein
MKPLPKNINKKKMVELYSDQYPALQILKEIRSIQTDLGIPITKGLLSNKVKGLFFKDFGLPTGYEMTDESKFEIN